LDPIFRAFERELTVAGELSRTIQQDLEQMLSVCAGESKQTNRMRELLTRVSKGQVPKEWSESYNAPKTLSVSLWFVDLVSRLQQLSHFASADFTALNRCFWLGGLFNPEAFITATRQAAARANKWSLESLVLSAELLPESADQSEYDPSCFVVKQVRMEGAAPEGTRGICVGDQIATALSPIRFSWKPASQQQQQQQVDDSSGAASRISVPVYLNQTREQILFHVDMLTSPSSTSALWFQRSVCLQLWFSSL
jgi:dynein cytoplasmic 1 heavy chain